MIKGIRPALAEGGKIKCGRLGEERTSQGGKKFRMPQKLDFFLITKTNRDAKGDLEIDAALMQALAKSHASADGKLREIPIVLHSDEIDECFPSTYALYSGRKLACRGNGEVALRWKFKDKQRTDETFEVKCTCEYLYAANGPVCKPHGTLHCSIVAPGQAVAGAVHKWRTTSIISIQRMIGSLQQILATCGTLRGLPLVLRLEPVVVTPDGKTSTVYCCHVELRAKDLLSVQRQALEVAQMRRQLSDGRDPDRAYRELIRPPAGDHETEEEIDEVVQEYDLEGNAIEQPPDEPTVGVHTVGKRNGNGGNGHAKPPAAEEPPHNAETGEVEQPQAAKPAAPPKQNQQTKPATKPAQNPTGQGSLGWGE